MHPNAELLEGFYSSFAKLDHQAMIACYSPESSFKDPVFEAQGLRAKAMWHMLCSNATDLEVTFGAIRADDKVGKAQWEAKYTFSGTGRKVHNIIDSEFVFENGLIKSQWDQFDLWKWTRMALGPLGTLLGWSLVLQSKVRGRANHSLDAFIKSHPEYQAS